MGGTMGGSNGAAALRRYLPLAAIAAVVAVVAVIAVVSGGSGGDDDGSGAGETASGGYTYTSSWGESITLPEGVLPFSVAEELGIEVDWAATCDTSRGTAAVPSFFAPECFAPFEGDNGGATATGVTADTIRVVIYEAPENDAILDAISGAVTDDSPSDVTATYQGLLPYFEQHYETYGRDIEYIVYPATGGAIDEVAARAAAAEIAEEIQPFAVFGGPAITNAFSDELAARGIVHVGAGGPSAEYFVEQDPYLFGVGMSAWQLRQHLIEYIGKQLANQPAEHAGDPGLAEANRVFGLVYLDSGSTTTVGADELRDGLAAVGADLAVTATYANPLDVSAEAPGIIARLKDAGVTSVILSGDPLTPATFTRVATDQGYFPEWIVAGSPLADTTVFARTYDQQQWANAFGISTLVARSDPQLSNGRRLYRWSACSDPPAQDTIELIYPIPAVFFSALQRVGPNLTPETFRTALFTAEPTPRGITSPSLSWGLPAKGRWDQPDYQGIDDATELWWDVSAAGPDENGRDGQGMYAYVDGGTRYLAGEWPQRATRAFEPDGAVTLYTEPPASEQVPSYPSVCDNS
jgi:hypothetical protein